MLKFIKTSIRFCHFIKQYSTEPKKLKTKLRYTIRDDSLDRRLLNYLKNQTTDSSEVNYDCNHLSSMNNQELLHLITGSSKPFIKTIDIECRKRLDMMNTTEIFAFLHKLAESYPELITKLPFYEHSLNKLNYSTHILNKDEIVKLCFYTSLQKKSVFSQQIVRSCLSKFNSDDSVTGLTTEDVVIVCNSAFKTSTRIHQKPLLNEIQNKVYNQLSILNDEAFFVTIIKSLRHNRNYDEELLATITSVLFFNKIIHNYNFTALVHILALYADGLYYNEHLLKVINKRSLEFFKKAQITDSTDYFNSNTVRIKDLNRYLWGFSYLGYDLSVTNIELRIIPIVKQYMKLDTRDKIYEDLFGCCLAFVFFGYYPLDILNDILTNQLPGRCKKNFKARLNIVLTCLQLEKPQFLNTLKMNIDPPPNYNIIGQVQRRPYLAFIYSCVNDIKNDLHFTKVEFSCEIPHLSIVGVSCYSEHDCKLYIECVDDETCVKNTEYSPNGPMKLKLRLLRSYRKPILRINQNEVVEMSEEGLKQYLKRKIKRLIKVD